MVVSQHDYRCQHDKRLFVYGFRFCLLLLSWSTVELLPRCGFVQAQVRSFSFFDISWITPVAFSGDMPLFTDWGRGILVGLWALLLFRVHWGRLFVSNFSMQYFHCHPPQIVSAESPPTYTYPSTLPDHRTNSNNRSAPTPPTPPYTFGSPSWFRSPAFPNLSP